MSRSDVARGGGLLFAAAVVVALPAAISEYRALEFGYVAIYFIAMLGLNVLTGFVGQVSLGHGAFMGIGGYTTAILAAHHGVPDLATIPLAGLAAGLVGFLFGFPALRLAGVYLALATFALAVALPSVAKRFEGLTGGSNGIFLPRIAPTGDWVYYVSWTVAAVMFALAWFLLRGKLGRTFRAIRDSELAAVSSGISLPRYKTIGFGISAFYAGVAGALLAIPTGAVFPDTFGVNLSILLLTGVVVGGVASLWGMVAGAMFVQFVPVYGPEWLRHVLGPAGVEITDATPGVPAVLYGAILLAVLLVARSGFAGLVHQGAVLVVNRFYDRRVQSHATPSRRHA